MIRFTALLRDLQTLPAYLSDSDSETRAAALSLLHGTRPRRLITLDALTKLATATAQIPDALCAACLAASGDRAETAALILPPPTLPAPDLSTLLKDLQHATPLTRDATIRRHWQSLPPEARQIYNRLITGTFRTTLPTPRTPQSPRTIHALLTHIDLTNPVTLTLALPHAKQLIPIARLPLPSAMTPQIIPFTRANTLEKFGPVRSLPATQVFEITFHGTTPNARRKSRLDLIAPIISAWRDDLTPDQVPPLSDLTLTP